MKWDNLKLDFGHNNNYNWGTQNISVFASFVYTFPLEKSLLLWLLYYIIYISKGDKRVKGDMDKRVYAAAAARLKQIWCADNANVR